MKEVMSRARNDWTAEPVAFACCELLDRVAGGEVPPANLAYASAALAHELAERGRGNEGSAASEALHRARGDPSRLDYAIVRGPAGAAV
jgi:hypothetical protein